MKFTTLLPLLLYVSFSHQSLILPSTPFKSPSFGVSRAGEVWISILTELCGNLWLGFVSTLYDDDHGAYLSIERGDCFGHQTFSHLKSLSRVTSAVDTRDFYHIMAQLVLQLYDLASEVKDSCKFERIYNDMKTYCEEGGDACETRRVAMRTMANF